MGNTKTHGADDKLEILVGSIIPHLPKLKTLLDKLPPASCEPAEGQDGLQPGQRRKGVMNTHHVKRESHSTRRVHLSSMLSRILGFPAFLTSIWAADLFGFVLGQDHTMSAHSQWALE